jgi:hypothetical protein
VPVKGGLVGRAGLPRITKAMWKGYYLRVGLWSVNFRKKNLGTWGIEKSGLRLLCIRGSSPWRDSIAGKDMGLVFAFSSSLSSREEGIREGFKQEMYI